MLYHYEMLTPTRRMFVDAAIKLLPELTNKITHKQIKMVQNEYNLSFPQWITSVGNKAEEKATYYFPNKGLEVINKDGTHTVIQPQQETDEEVLERIKDTYDSMDELVRSVAANNVNSLVIAGGAGVGKSHNVNQILQEVNDGEYGYVFHRGYLKATHLFRMLYENRHPGMVLVLDDCDIWGDEVSLNILKAALELKPVRKIGWGSEKIFFDDGGDEIPRYFQYEGSVIFLTNLNVRELINSGSKYAPHLSAIESRSLVLDMKIKSKRDYLTVIKVKLEDGLLRDKGFSKREEDEIISFVEQNSDKMVELSLRMVEKVAFIYRASPNKWEKLCRSVCLK